MDLTSQLTSIVAAGKSAKLPDQLIGFLLRNAPGTLDRIRQQLQLRQLKGPAAQIVAPMAADNVHALIRQRRKIPINALPL